MIECTAQNGQVHPCVNPQVQSPSIWITSIVFLAIFYFISKEFPELLTLGLSSFLFI